MVFPLSSKCSDHLIVFIVSFFLVDYESTFHTMSFISKTEERPRCNLFASSLSFGIRNTVKTISSLCPMSLNGMKWTIPLNSEWISAPTWNDLLDWTPYQRCDPHDFLETVDSKRFVATWASTTQAYFVFELMSALPIDSFPWHHCALSDPNRTRHGRLFWSFQFFLRSSVISSYSS